MKIFKFLLSSLIFQLFICFNILPADKIAVYSDSRTNHAVHQKIVDEIFDLKPIAVFHVGDMVEFSNNKKQWEIFSNIISKLKANSKFYPVIGNRDKNSNLYFETFNIPLNQKWYSVDIDKIHFIILDSNSKLDLSSDQYKWFISDLNSANTSSALFKIVLFHHPIISSGENDNKLKEIMLPVLKQYKIDAVFNGHNHGYERLIFDNINFIITAGGGAPLDDMISHSTYTQIYKKIYNFCVLYTENKKMTIEAYDIDMKLIDKVEINK